MNGQIRAFGCPRFGGDTIRVRPMVKSVTGAPGPDRFSRHFLSGPNPLKKENPHRSEGLIARFQASELRPLVGQFPEELENR